VKNGLGYILGDFFHNIVWSPWQRATKVLFIRIFSKFLLKREIQNYKCGDNTYKYDNDTNTATSIYSGEPLWLSGKVVKMRK
jgi:hypothetical protein